MTVVCSTECVVYKDSERWWFSLPFVEKEQEGLMSVVWHDVDLRGRAQSRWSHSQARRYKADLVARWDVLPGIVNPRGRNTEEILTGCLNLAVLLNMHRTSEQFFVIPASHRWSQGWIPALSVLRPWQSPAVLKSNYNLRDMIKCRYGVVIKFQTKRAYQH